MSLDKKTANTRTGRPGVRHSEIVGRAMNYRSIFWCHRLDKRKKEWVRDKPYTWAMALVAAKTTDEVSHALESAPSYAQNEFKPLIPVILKVLQERAFPKVCTLNHDNCQRYKNAALAAAAAQAPDGTNTDALFFYDNTIAMPPYLAKGIAAGYIVPVPVDGGPSQISGIYGGSQYFYGYTNFNH